MPEELPTDYNTALTTQDEEGLETTLAGSTVHRSTPEEQPTAS